MQDLTPTTRSTPALPHSDEAERCVLGAVLLDNSQFPKAQQVLRPSSFYASRHQKIYQAIEDLIDGGGAADLVTLKAELDRSRSLEEAGGHAYLATLLESVPRSANVEHYARIVKEKHTLRELIRSAQDILQSAFSAEGATDDILDDAEGAIFRVAEDRLRAGFLPLKTIGEQTLKTIEELTESPRLVTGIPTDFADLDSMTTGLQKSDLIVLAARPSMGKTTLALNIADNAAARHGKTVGVFSLEMSREQLFIRMLCARARVESHRLRTGRLGADEWQNLIKGFGELQDAPIFIDDTPGLGIMEMRAKARRLKMEHGLDLLVVDYLQLMRGRTRAESRQQEISEISRSLKELAKELDIPVIALSQLSRAPEQRGGDHRPQLSDLRESGAIEQDADVVLFLFREEVYKKGDPDLRGKAELIIGKQRNGPIGVIPLVFVKEFTRFENAMREESLG